MMSQDLYSKDALSVFTPKHLKNIISGILLPDLEFVSRHITGGGYHSQYKVDVFSVDARDAEIIGSSRLFSDGLDDDVGRWWVFSELSRGGGHAHKLFQLLVKLPAVERHENFVNECYRAFLQRLADPGGLSLYSRQLIEKRMSGRDLINIILKSAEGVAVNRRFIVIQHPNRLLNDFVASNHARKILMLNVS